MSALMIYFQTRPDISNDTDAPITDSYLDGLDALFGASTLAKTRAEPPNKWSLPSSERFVAATGTKILLYSSRPD